MFWCCLQVAYVLSILCPVVWCPCPEIITHYWCDVQDVSRPCPGRVQQAVNLELFWTCSWRTLPTKLVTSLYSRCYASSFPIIIIRYWDHHLHLTSNRPPPVSHHYPTHHHRCCSCSTIISSYARSPFHISRKDNIIIRQATSKGDVFFSCVGRFCT